MAWQLNYTIGIIDSYKNVESQFQFEIFSQPKKKKNNLLLIIFAISSCQGLHTHA